MRSHYVLGALMVLTGLMTPTPATSHHAIQAQFDFEEKGAVKLTGKLTKIDWLNPHAYFTLEVMENGKMTEWHFESFGPGGMRKAGLSRRGFFSIGETYTLDGYRSRDGAPMAWLKSLTGPDGKVIQIWYGDPNPE